MNHIGKRRVAVVAAALLMTGSTLAQSVYDARYAADRAQIEDLEARYVYALDWQDADAYAATFTEDGVLDWAQGVAKGREAIRAEVHGMRQAFAKKEAADSPQRPSRLRHFITNLALSVHGDTATDTAYWMELDDDNRYRRPVVGAYGHYEDELRRVDGRWLFSKRKIFNEQMDSRAASAVNPVAR